MYFSEKQKLSDFEETAETTEPQNSAGPSTTDHQSKNVDPNSGEGVIYFSFKTIFFFTVKIFFT